MRPLKPADLWQGESTSIDEAGGGAILATVLDEAFGGAPIQHREEQGKESENFLALFKSSGGMITLEGGVDSGFRHVPGAFEDAPPPVLLHVTGTGSKVKCIQVKRERASLNDSDVFILDDNKLLITVWQGSRASPFERNFAAQVAHRLDLSRGGRPKVLTLDAETAEADPAAAAFWAALS